MRIILVLPLLALGPAGFFLSFNYDGRGVALVDGDPISVPRGGVHCAARGTVFSAVQLHPEWIHLLDDGLRGEFSAQQIRTCADVIRRKCHDGTLTVDPHHKGHHTMPNDAVIAPQSVLPPSLRGGFKRVYIDRNHETGEERVYFAFDEHTGLVRDRRKRVRDGSERSIGDYVHAYRYLRM